MNYKDAGVDIEAGYKAVNLMKSHVRKTFRKEVLSDIGGFGGMFAPNFSNMKEPVLVSGTDGVGTKLKIAMMLNKHDTIGIDCVAMCVNDIVCCGAEPLFFLDYIAVGKNVPEKIEAIVSGIANGCVEAKCALVGGETAEMPGIYTDEDYDVAGFAVGMVDRRKIIDGKTIRSGDKLIGLASSGLHSNGFSLVRKALNLKDEENKLDQFIDSIGTTIALELLKPTRIYVSTILDLISRFEIKGISNITGGGFYENIPRMVPEHLRCLIRKGSWDVLPIFGLLSEIGDIKEKVMYNTFNMGIGMVLAVSSENVDTILNHLNAASKQAYVIGEIVEGESGVEIC